jgi:hypothetical protein
MTLYVLFLVHTDMGGAQRQAPQSTSCIKTNEVSLLGMRSTAASPLHPGPILGIDNIFIYF